MPLATEFREERNELEAVLRSGVFGRSPVSAQFLQYICGRYFEGRAGEIKEYNVATEALGRPIGFDQKKDSIVRVEAHRLRKRLHAYYETEGAGRPIRIVVPPGTYAPVFVHQDPVEPLALATVPPPVVTATRPGAPKHDRRVLAGLILAVVLAGAAGVVYRARSSEASTDTPVIASLPGDAVRLMAGSEEPRYVDSRGEVWTGDRFFSGGTAAFTNRTSTLRTNDPALFRGRREGEFRYDIPLNPGDYELRLYFAEQVFGESNEAGGGESSRLFSVRANGVSLLDTFDIVSDAGGPNVADVRVFRGLRPADDGQLHLEFIRVKENALLNGLELLPAPAGSMLPVRMVARSRAVADSSGVHWDGDRFVQGGQLVERRDEVTGTPQPELYRYERYGHFSYAIPVAPGGRYTLRLRFSEHWFGPGRTGGGGRGERVFDVYCNGRALLRNFDVFAEAGGSLRALDKTFPGLEPNAQGKLLLQFVPVRNYAMVNAIEVLDERR